MFKCAWENFECRCWVFALANGYCVCSCQLQIGTKFLHWNEIDCRVNVYVVEMIKLML